MTFLYVGVGSALGATLRYLLTVLIEKRIRAFPVATLVINVTGAFLLGIVAGLQVKQAVYLFVATGIIGGYTTFSTLNFELWTLMKTKRTAFYWYFGLTYGLGFLGQFIGLLLSMAGRS